MAHSFHGIVGKNGEAVTISTEMPIKHLLGCSTRLPFNTEAGLDIDSQEGIQRPVDEKRTVEIAKVFDDQLKRGYPMENGSVVLACTNAEDLKIDVLDKATGYAKITILNPLPASDRQHTTESFRVADNKPQEYPTLAAYINDIANTVCVRIVKDSSQNALRRTLAMNTGQKKWTPVEMLIAMVLDAKRNEAAGIASHQKERPSLVMFQFAHNVASDENHPLHSLLPVVAGMKYDAKKNPTNLARFIDAMWPLHQILEKEVKGYKDMKIEEQAEYVETLTQPFWTSLQQYLPASFGNDTWYNYNTIRKGTPLLAECFNAFIRLWIEYRTKKSSITILGDINRLGIEEFCKTIIPRFIEESDPSFPFKNEKFWNTNGGAFTKKYAEEGEDETNRYIWSTLKPKNVGDDNWLSFLRTIQSHANKLRYNERKSVQSAEEVKKRRAAKKEKLQAVAA